MKRCCESANPSNGSYCLWDERYSTASGVVKLSKTGVWVPRLCNRGASWFIGAVVVVTALVA